MPTDQMQSGGSNGGSADVRSSRFADLSVHQLHEILALRSAVFVVEQSCVYNDIDGRDSDATTEHLWIERDGRIAAYLRVLGDDGPSGEAIVGRVVTHPEHRGDGLAARLMHAVIESHDGPIALEAQAHLEHWYGRFGFKRTGEEYLEDGIAHISMRRSHPIE